MNKLSKKITAFCLCTALCVGGVSAASAQSQTKSTSVTKDETVYVLTDAAGSVQKLIVSDWLKNTDQADTLRDSSALTDIENVKGEEAYSVSGSSLLWDAQGNDIYYQGSIKKTLPVDMTVSYLLDGAPISAQELAGKSGKVTIRFDYVNHQYEMMQVNGKREKIYVPFTMITGMLLDNDTFRNVTVSNGKLVNDGDRSIVIGIAFPGLQENLALDRDVLDIPDFVEITADVTNFTLNMTATIATTELFNALNAEDFDSAEDATSAIDELTDAMEQLTDGSSELYNGLCTLLEKANELADGVDRLAAGANDLNTGANKLNDGANDLLTGANELSVGLNAISENSAELNNGAKAVFQTLLSTATEQIRAAGISVKTLTIDNYADTLQKLIASLDEDAVYKQVYDHVSEAVEAQRETIETQVTDTVKAQVTEQVTAAVKAQVTQTVTTSVEQQITEQVLQSMLSMSTEDYQAAVAAGTIGAEQQAQINAAIAEELASATTQKTITDTVAAQMSSDSVTATISAKIAEQMQTTAIKNTIAQNTEAQVKKAIATQMESDAVKEQLKSASDGAQSIIALKTSLDSYHAFYLGVRTYTGSVDQAASGAQSLASGAEELKGGIADLNSGAAKLYSGTAQLKSNMPALLDGVTELRDGSLELSDGLERFNEEGVQKIVNLINDDFDGIVSRMKATVDAAKAYRNFSGMDAQADGSVKFIYRTDEIKVK